MANGYNQLSNLDVDGVVQSTAQGIFIGSATAMPTASANLNGVMVLYVGTTGTYTQNTFYMCNGTAWNQVDVFPQYDITPGTVVIVGSDGSLQSSAVTTTELGYLSGATSNIQVQFTTLGGQLSTAQENIATLQGQMSTANGNISTLQGQVSALDTDKQDVITGGATSIVSDNLTVNSALVSDGSGKVAVSPVTSTELGYVQGATSSIQAQINTLASQIASLSGFSVQVVSSLPSTGDSGTMYFVPSSSGSGQNVYDEYLYVNGAWEQVGSTAFSLNIQQSATGITINGTALQDASSTQDGLMTSAQVSALTTAQNNIGTLQTQMSTANSNISELQSDLSTTDSQVSTLESTVSGLEPSISVNESSSPPTITVGMNGKTSTANLPSGGGGWTVATNVSEIMSEDGSVITILHDCWIIIFSKFERGSIQVCNFFIPMGVYEGNTWDYTRYVFYDNTSSLDIEDNGASAGIYYSIRNPDGTSVTEGMLTTSTELVTEIDFETNYPSTDNIEIMVKYIP